MEENFVSAIAVVSKCPIPGKSKTRLIPKLGEDGSAALAKAMLSDVVLTLQKCEALAPIPKILLYAPGNEEGLKHMNRILSDLEVPSCHDESIWATTRDTWFLLPLKSVGKEMQSSNLGDLLADSLTRIRKTLSKSSELGTGSVAFLGMDSPILPLEDLYNGLAVECTSAILCPADDGGYGMLTLPHAADAKRTFASGVHWSHPLTAVSQIKALTDQGIHVRIGRLMHDIDEPEDVQRLVERVQQQTGCEQESKQDEMLLDTSSKMPSVNCKAHSLHSPLSFTRQALADASLLL